MSGGEGILYQYIQIGKVMLEHYRADRINHAQTIYNNAWRKIQKVEPHYVGGNPDLFKDIIRTVFEQEGEDPSEVMVLQEEDPNNKTRAIRIGTQQSLEARANSQ